ncbi:hypothetical protein [Hymenobacter properus]|uniref:Lipoprotein n=1 Tax=Hymenobacter properus TaxID=2791026 RepID=A0A931FJQ6_9BACT|nr:hypothetical protein [Hymenobacter properus]MBF9140805.1 hypothetical protein [Hymenobacter properus]MBR7719614.1 hypothetical protein [Microvirga sp. SRT04]
MRKLLLLALLPLFSACAVSQQPQFDEQEAFFIQNSQSINQEYTFREAPRYYARMDSTGAPEAVEQPRDAGYKPEPFDYKVRTAYVLGRVGPWYRVRRLHYRSYYVLASSMWPAGRTGPITAPTLDSSTPASHNYQTGPRGGVYYINKNGNKTYRKR